MANILISGGLLLICLAAVLNILALSLNFWEKSEFTSTSLNNRGKRIESYRGLWKVCTKANDTAGYVCLNYEPNTDTPDGAKIILVRAALFLSILLLTASVVCNILELSVVVKKHFLVKSSGILSVAAGLMSLVAFSVYTSLKDSCSDYMAAFYLAILGWLVAWAAAGLVFAASMQDDQAFMQYTIFK